MIGMARGVIRFVFLLGVIGCLVAAVRADDWPTYRQDSRRQGISKDELKAPLSPQWVFTATDAPENAWGDPQTRLVENVLELPKLRFDDAFHLAAVGDRVFFGSSADNKVYALEAKTGQIRWEFYTDGPVRLAPTVWKGKVYVGSDDGKVYCLEAGNGRLIWTFTAAPSPEKVLGNGKMISLWPVRTGVLVDNGVAYFGAGVFPSEGLYLYAVKAEDGKLLWKNNSYGQGGLGAISPQGYLLASKERLFVPSGRSMPAAFSREDGRFLFHQNLSRGAVGLFGGTYCLLAQDLLFTAAEQVVAVHESTGQFAFSQGLPVQVPSKGSKRLVVDAKTTYILTGAEAIAVDSARWMTTKSQVAALEGRVGMLKGAQRRYQQQAAAGAELTQQLQYIENLLNEAVPALEELKKQLETLTRWRVPCKFSESIALARGLLFAGGTDVVTAFDSATGRKVWSAKVDGKARGLAIANRRLLVSTDEGSIHCFISGPGGAGRHVAPAITADPFPKDELTELYANVAESIVRETGVKRGYGLILGGGTGRLALELAKRTDLLTYMVEPDAAKVAAARRALTAAGVYGSKVVVMQGALEALPFAEYFANLIVCESGFFAQRITTPAEEVLRMLKPCGGVIYAGGPLGKDASPGEVPTLMDWLTALRKRLTGLGETETKVTVNGPWAKVVRGSLNGAGSWTHQYADAGNTACSDDRLVRGPIGTLWYGEPGPGRMPSRHACAAAPLAIGGRLFVQGENMIMGYDAYNGLLLWERPIPGAMRLGLQLGVSNLAANADSLFAVIRDHCFRLDPATGRTIRGYGVPPAKDENLHNWDYLACVGNRIYGSSGNTVFARDIETSQLLWAYTGQSIMLKTICIGDGRLFLVDRGVTEEQRQQGLKGVTHSVQLDAAGKPIPPDVRLVIALNAETGEKVWERPQYAADCVKIGSGGGELTAMYANQVLLLCAQPWNGHFWGEFFAGRFSRRSLIALAADDGRLLWSGHKGYRSRPLILDDNLILAEPWAHDLKTGVEKLRVHPVTGARVKWQMSRPGHHCGNIAGAPNALFFRSGCTAYYDLSGDYGTAHFGAQRPGCWINAIPANGVVMMPEASSGCVCPFALHCTIVFHPRKVSRVWGMFSAPGPTVPARRLAVNFGAPGDRKDSQGMLWLGYPRPRTGRLVLDLGLVIEGTDDGGFFQDNANFLQMAGTDDAWIYASGGTGLESCTIPVAADGAPPARYTVQLHFAAPEKDQPGRRVFDVQLQGRTVLKDFDIVKAAGGPDRAVVKEFRGVQLKKDLALTFKATTGESLLCGLTLVKENVPPRAEEMEVPGVEGHPMRVKFAVTDPDDAADEIWVSVVTPPAHGRLEVQEKGRYVYSPEPGYVGEDRFTWRAYDGMADSNVAQATVKLQPDTGGPLLEWARAHGEETRVLLRFNEPIDPVTAGNAANYAISPGVTVEKATPGTDGRTALLTTSKLADGATYTLTVNRVRDRALRPNAIAANTRQSFKFVGPGDGLAATYYDNMDFTGKTLKRIDPQIEFLWTEGSPDKAINDETFSVRWVGRLRAEFTEPYTLYTRTDDGVRLWLDGELLVDLWRDQAATEANIVVRLEAGRFYDLKMEYYENLGYARAGLFWSSPSTPKQVIPKTHLYTPADAGTEEKKAP